ncbi:C1q-like domain-containing protein [Aulosira sp. FACHB-615]|uniref:C1q-like domain-containing protein n=1 Tax=Aulosira sp. FACHB-615 TaxID=2692777 RepID=UPI0016854EE0|nr:hypothetical protein [Aulosira sp. FACHB-615]MBD2492390.1 hypothetical protein [Aulosira sp. FACHB-615]
MPLTIPFNATGLNKPTLIVRRVAAQNISHATSTKIMWDTVVNDSANGYSISTGLFTVGLTNSGIYFCTARCSYSGENVRRHLLSVIVNSTSFRLDDARGSADDKGYAGGSTLLLLNAGDTVRVETYQENSTTSTKATASGGTNLEWSMFRLNT